MAKFGAQTRGSGGNAWASCNDLRVTLCGYKNLDIGRFGQSEQDLVASGLMI